MSAASAIDLLARRDRWIVGGGLVLVAGLAWLYLVDMAAGMDGMAGMGEMMMPKPWTLGYGAMMFAMWAIMMVAMMVPSAVPMILLHARIWRKRRPDGASGAPTAAFAAGYVLLWTLFSLAATVLQWGLEAAALVSPMMASTSAVFSGLVLLAAGAYQFTPWKEACLRHCRSPIEFLAWNWRPGARGAVVMGLHHGLFCLGCCWVLMALLFVGGVMNLLCIAAITLFVLMEKVAPFGRAAGRVLGGLSIAGGALLIAGA